MARWGYEYAAVSAGKMYHTIWPAYAYCRSRERVLAKLTMEHHPSGPFQT